MAPVMNPGRQTGRMKRQAWTPARAPTVLGPITAWRSLFAEGRAMAVATGLADWRWRCSVCRKWSAFGGHSCPYCSAVFSDFPPVVVAHGRQHEAEPADPPEHNRRSRRAALMLDQDAARSRERMRRDALVDYRLAAKARERMRRAARARNGQQPDNGGAQ